MSKTIFEGVINGEKFDNVADYNNRMTSLLNSGAKVNASASTKTVECDEDCNYCGCDCGCCSCRSCNDESEGYSLEEVLKSFGLDMNSIMPGFGKAADPILNRVFTNLDNVSFEDLNNLNLDNITAILSDEDYINKVKESTTRFSDTDLEKYFNIINKIVYSIEHSSTKEKLNEAKLHRERVELSNDYQKYNNAIAELENSLTELKKDAEDTEHSLEMLDKDLAKIKIFNKLSTAFKKFYKPVREDLISQLEDAGIDVDYHVNSCTGEDCKPNDKKPINWQHAEGIPTNEPETTFTETEPQDAVEFCTDNLDEETVKKIEQLATKLAPIVNMFTKDIVPSDVNAANLFGDIFGPEAKEEFLKSRNKKKKSKRRS